MENEEKKDIDTKPETKPGLTPEEAAAKKLRDKNDLRIFGIAFMAAIIVVSGYHIGRQIVRIFITKPRAEIRRTANRPGPRPEGEFKQRRGPRRGPGNFRPCTCPRHPHGPGFKPRRGPKPGPKKAPAPEANKPEVKKPEAPKTDAKKPEAKKPEAPKPAPAPTAPEKK